MQRKEGREAVMVKINGGRRCRHRHGGDRAWTVSGKREWRKTCISGIVVSKPQRVMAGALRWRGWYQSVEDKRCFVSSLFCSWLA